MEKRFNIEQKETSLVWYIIMKQWKFWKEQGYISYMMARQKQ